MSGTPDMLTHMGGAPVGMEILQPGTVRWAYSSKSAAPYDHRVKSASADQLHSTVALAHAAATTGRNDVVFLSPETHNQTATITWSKSNTHLIGNHNGSRWANSCVIQNTSATAVVPVLTVSGSNNLIANLHIKNAIGSNASNLTGLRVSGSGNLFQNCWFEGPCDNSVADLDTARTVQIGGGGNVFKNCVFGSTSVFLSGTGAEDGPAILEYYTTTYRSSFENCLFYCLIDSITPQFITVKTGKAQGIQFFKDCQFVANSTSQAYDMYQAVNFEADDATSHFLFDINCTFINVTNITTGVNPTASVYFGHGGCTPSGTAIGRGIVSS